MSNARILDRWNMPLSPPTASDEEWFLDWVMRSPAQVSHHLTAGWSAYSALRSVYLPREIQTVVECFGGMGAQSLMIQELFRPALHYVHDYSPAAVAHIRRTVPAVEASPRDAYAADLSLKEPDLVGLDFGDLTAWRTRDGEKQRVLLDKVFAVRPKAFVMTDIAGPRLHLQRERYESLLGAGACASYASYLDALVARLTALSGYRLLAGYTHRWSTVMAFVPEEVLPSHPVGMVDTPSAPIGLEIVS